MYDSVPIGFVRVAEPVGRGVAGLGAAGPRPALGFLSLVRGRRLRSFAAGFIQDVKQTRYVKGQNITIEYCWAD